MNTPIKPADGSFFSRLVEGDKASENSTIFIATKNQRYDIFTTKYCRNYVVIVYFGNVQLS